MPIPILDSIVMGANSAIDFNKVAALQFVVPVVAADPAGYEAGFIYNSTEKVIKWHNGTAWKAIGEKDAPSPPNGAAGGDLSGTYPNPQIAAGVIMDADVNASANIAQSKISGLTTSLGGKVATSTTITAGNGLTGGGDLSSNRTLDVGAGTGITVSADSIAVDTVWSDARYINVTGDTLTGPLVLSGNPTAANEAANKAYVDLSSQGYTFKAAVRVVAVTNVALSGLQTIDGVTLVANNRVLVANNTAPADNGIWVAAAGAWTRATDMDASGELGDGTLVPVAQGTLGQDSQYMCISTTADPWVPASSGSTWTRQSGLADLNAGAGLTKTGTTIDFVAGDTSLTVAANDVRVAHAPKWSATKTLQLTGDVTSGAIAFDGSANFTIPTTVVNAGKRYVGDVPSNGVITHNLNTRDLQVQVFRNTTPWDSIMCGVEKPDVNTVNLKFATAPTASAYRVVILG